VMLANTTLEPSGQQPSSLDAYAPRIIGTRTFLSFTIERFEGVVHSAYFLPRTSDVLEFDITEHDVASWTDPRLIPDNLPPHQALVKMLGTLEESTPQPE